MNVTIFFNNLRHSKKHHLGLGDIRIPLSQQEEIVEYVQGLENALDNAIEHLSDLMWNRLNYTENEIADALAAYIEARGTESPNDDRETLMPGDAGYPAV